MCENDEMKGKIDKEELLLELSQCREDERNCKNQMVQVISTASTILGVLFGSTYFSFGKGGFSKVEIYQEGLMSYLSLEQVDRENKILDFKTKQKK